ncbi:MAG TPA: sulfotransferase [Steroidobacteraceae bacterium]|nr:sulfotransferase [Steroidobacteraceae bacterium]
MTAQREQCEPVFVVGMNGSGTTMLLDCLGRHPSLYAFPKETRLIPYLMARERTYGDLAVDANFKALWDDVLALPAFREANGRMPVPLPDDWNQQPRRLAAILDALFRQFAAREGKRRWCEKTPQHVQHLLALAREFPQARFIHVIRDGRDCAVSFHRRWKRQPELTIFRWKKVVSMGREQGRRLGPARYLEVRYEDLTAQPEHSLRRICEFLDVPFDPRVLDSAQPYLRLHGARRHKTGLQRNSNKWRGYFQPRTIERLERIAGRTLAHCGYATRAPDSDRDVSRWRRRYWSVAESLREYAQEIWRKLNGELERPWRVILVKPMTALRHRQHNVY